MKTANIYEIERALQQPITPQQRQTAAANNPLAAIIAQRLDGVEGSLRQKIQTPPPPQGTVMNQYFQWPQQESQYGLAQPGLEELAQQYASGGLVAFANGGVASMLPMGYAGEEDMPVFNGYAEGGGALRSVFPYTDFDEEDEDAFWEEERNNTTPAPIEDKKEQSALGKLGSTLSDIAFIKVPEQAPPPDHKPLSEDIARTGKAALDRIAGAGERWSERLAPVKEALAPLTDRFKAGQAERERIEGLPAAYAAAIKAGEPMPEVKYEPTISGEDIKREKQQAENTKKHAAEVAKKEAPTKAKKTAQAAPTPAPTQPAGQGISLLSPEAWNAERGAGLTPTSYEPSSELPTVITNGRPDEINLNPNNNATAAAIVNSNLTAEQQIAALEKYFQTDTSEAMRIKGEMEKDNARAGNLGILTALAGAVGAGLGTYGPGARRWGAGLMQLASGVMGEQQQAEARQAKLNDLALKVKEMQGSGTRKAAEMVLTQRAKAAAEAEEMKKALILEQMKTGRAMNVANVHKAGQTEAAEIAAAARAQNPDGGARLQVQKDRIAADLLAKAAEAVKTDPTSPGYATAKRAALSAILADAPESIKQMFPSIESVLSAGGMTSPRGPSIGTITRQGGFAPQG